MNNIEILVADEENGIRIDTFLSGKFEEKSRSYFQGLIEDGNILVNNKEKKSNYKVKTKDNIMVTFPEAVELQVIAEDIELNIIYEDKDLIVINKPQEMVVHPAVGNYSGTIVNGLLFHCKDLSGINGVIRPGIVHRIDKDTSGVLVIAKNDKSHNKLSDQLKDHSMNRTYYALVEGRIKEDGGTVDKPLGRSPKDRLKMAIQKDGKRAVTHYEVITRYESCTLIKCKLETGRTHQIRVHMASLSHPLLGDKVYGFKKQRYKLKGQMLHAKELGFIHPSKNIYVEFKSELPDYFKEILKKLENELI